MGTSDQEAVTAALRDRNAFSVLVDRYEAPILRYIQRLSALDRDSAMDILQETFINAYVNLNDYDPSLRFNSWLYRIAHNQTMSHFRRTKNRAHPVHYEDSLALFEQLPDELDIAEETDVKLRNARIARALEQLSQRYRDIVVLRFFEGKSYDEISDILQIPPGTVATNLARGKRALQTLLRQEHITDVYYENHE